MGLFPPTVGMATLRLLLLASVLASALHAPLCRAACVEVDSDTEAVAGLGFKLGCISCKMRGEVPATATVDWFFKATDESDFSHIFSYEAESPSIMDDRFWDRIDWNGSKKTNDLQDGSIYILNVTFNDTGVFRCFFDRVLTFSSYEFRTHATKFITLNVVAKATRGTASILSEVMMYVSIIGLQVWLVVEMVYCYRKISVAGEEALRESAYSCEESEKHRVCVRRQEDMSMCAHGRSPTPRKSRWLCLTVLVLLQQGNWGQITVTQSPSVVVSRLNHNATLACRFSHTPDQGVTGVILYWYHTGSNRQDLYVYPDYQARPEYKNRVVALDRNRTSEDKSVVLQYATWTDSQRYHCMLSYETPQQPQRKRGDGVLLLLHDFMTFDLAPGMVSELLCSVKVSPDPGFRLSVFRDGVHVQTAQKHTPAPYVTLSLLVPVAHNMECQLNHSSGFILSKTYSIQRNWGQITVTQSPSVVVSRLNHNATLACRFSHTPDQRVTGVILYWYQTGPNRQDLYVYPDYQARPEYKNRVVALDRNRTSEDKSVVLQYATWTDSQRYHCMLSYETLQEPQRKRGDGVLLLLHDFMTFDLAPGMVGELLCSVKVSPDPGFRLSVFRDGVHVRTAQNHTPAPYVTLSLLVPVAHNMECQLNHSSGFILSKTYSIQRNWSQITVTQSPSVVVSRLNHNATLACRFSHTPDQRVTGVILYWYQTGPNRSDLYVYPDSQAQPEYKNRVVALDRNRTSEDKSVVLQNATWTDSQRYHCMLSYERLQQPQRKKGEGVLLLLHDSMTFDLAPGMVSELLCSVKVSPDPGFRLSVFRDGVHVRTAQNHTPAPYVTLSLFVPVAHNMECWLNHSSGFILSKTYSIQSLPEPVLLYVAILLVPLIVFVISLTAHLIMTSRHVKSHGDR